ncbi:TPM domain-containing protein [Nocardia thailandica]
MSQTLRRVASLCGALAVLTLLCVPVAGAEPPSRLGPQVTDSAKALSPADEQRVRDAVGALYDDRRVQLWVVYVRDFAGMAAQDWAARTAQLSDLGDRDLLLAVATEDRGYAFTGELPAGISDSELDELLAGSVEPALREGDWAGAGVAAAQGLDSALGSGLSWGVVILLVVGVVVLAGAVALVLRLRRGRRERAELATARTLDPTDSAALGRLSLPTLHALSKERLVDIDNAIRTSAEELDLATGEFGDTAVTPFRNALEAAKAAAAQAFTIRQQLDDAIPETPDQQRALLLTALGAIGTADRELDAQVAAFDEMRDLLIGAAGRLDGLTRDVVDLTARVPAAEAELNRLVAAYPASVLAPVRDNVRMAGERMRFAEQNIDTARIELDRPVGEQGGAVAAIRAAEGAVGQARVLLDAVDNAASTIQQARDGLPAALDELRADLIDAATLTEHGGTELPAAVDAAQRAVREAGAAAEADPLTAYRTAVDADTALDLAIAAAGRRKAAAEDLRRRLDRAVADAAARVDAAASFVTTRRGGVDAEARTRLAEAQRHLEDARRLTGTDDDRALAAAQQAAGLGERALRQAQASVRAWESRQPMTGGNQAGAVLGGILLDGFLRGTMSGGGYRGGAGGGYRPGSYGGSSSSRRVSRGGRF